MNVKSLLLLLAITCLTFACSAETYDTATGEILQSDKAPIELGPKCSDANATWSCDKDNSTLDCRGADWGDPCHGDGYCNSLAANCTLIGEDPNGAAICRCNCTCDFEEADPEVGAVD